MSSVCVPWLAAATNATRGARPLPKLLLLNGVAVNFLLPEITAKPVIAAVPRGFIYGRGRLICCLGIVWDSHVDRLCWPLRAVSAAVRSRSVTRPRPSRGTSSAVAGRAGRHQASLQRLPAVAGCLVATAPNGPPRLSQAVNRLLLRTGPSEPSPAVMAVTGSHLGRSWRPSNHVKWLCAAIN